MKKLIPALIIILITLVACGKKPAAPGSTIPVTTEQEAPIETTHAYVEIKESPDKYTWYMKDYYGKNLVTIGELDYTDTLRERYGQGEIHFALFTPHGEYVDVNDENSLKQWWVVGQSIAPNTPIKYLFESKDDGTDSDYYVVSQNIEEVILALAPVGEKVEVPSFTQITPSPDRYTSYIYDYVGRNLTQCGYQDYNGLSQKYGMAEVRLIVNGENGVYVDVQDEEDMKNFVVTRQSVAPNTELKKEYEIKEDGSESQHYIKDTSIEEIELYVTRLDDKYIASDDVIEDVETRTTPRAAAASEETEEAQGESAIRPEFKAAMDAYEEFYGEYCEFLEKYSENPSDATLIGQYGKMMAKMTEVNAAFEKWNDADMTTAEAAYYLEVNGRVLQKLAKVMG